MNDLSAGTERQGDFTVDGVRIHYQIAGKGPPLLFIHGLGSNGDEWQPQLDFFARRYTVIAPDLRGHGRSDRPPGPYRMSTFAGELLALLGHLQIDAAHVVGLSLGGGIAFQLAVQAPKAVFSLTIVNSGPEFRPRTPRERLVLWQRLAIVNILGLRRLGELLAHRLFPEDGTLQRRFIEQFACNDRESYLSALRAFMGWSVMDRIEHIDVPVLVVAAENDYTPVSAKEAYVRRLPRARLAVIPNARHGLPAERPNEFNRCLSEFLDTIEVQSASTRPSP